MVDYLSCWTVWYQQLYNVVLFQPFAKAETVRHSPDTKNKLIHTLLPICLSTVQAACVSLSPSPCCLSSSLPRLFSPSNTSLHSVSTQANIELWLRCLSFLLLLSPFFPSQHRFLFLFELCLMWNSITLSQHESIILSLAVFPLLCLASYFTLKHSVWESLPLFDLWNSKHTHTHTHWKGLSEE